MRQIAAAARARPPPTLPGPSARHATPPTSGDGDESGDSAGGGAAAAAPAAAHGAHRLAGRRRRRAPAGEGGARAAGRRRGAVRAAGGAAAPRVRGEAVGVLKRRLGGAREAVGVGDRIKDSTSWLILFTVAFQWGVPPRRRAERRAARRRTVGERTPRMTSFAKREARPATRAFELAQADERREQHADAAAVGLGPVRPAVEFLRSSTSFAELPSRGSGHSARSGGSAATRSAGCARASSTTQPTNGSWYSESAGVISSTRPDGRWSGTSTSRSSWRCAAVGAPKPPTIAATSSRIARSPAAAAAAPRSSAAAPNGSQPRPQRRSSRYAQWRAPARAGSIAAPPRRRRRR